MTKRMLIDSTHAEETRVVVLDGNRLEDYDVETSTKRQLKGNIYLAKIVRVEPSLQAAFVEFGGGRHGFLAFGEIHPDYYQIPVADRKRLLELQEAEAREEEEAEEREASRQERGGEPRPQPAAEVQVPDEPAEAEPGAPAEAGAPELDTEPAAAAPEHEHEPGPEPLSEPPMPAPAQVAMPAAIAQQIVIAPEEAQALFPDEPAEPMLEGADLAPEAAEAVDGHPHQPAALPDEPLATEKPDAPPPEAAPDGERPDAPADDEGAGHGHIETVPQQAAPEHIGGELDTDDGADRRQTPRFMRNYKIQEVMRRRQILLVQVVKEERGTKGAALTTYISLAGRFSVLMPNSPRGGGISRKITSAADRRRLKEITAELDLPRGMGLIVRTAGAARPKPEILRDCEYLLNQWDQIRESTMRSMAPALIYEEASLIKRAIRDVYSRDVEEILVDGEEGWRAARDFMRMLMPAHAKKVQLWRDPAPLFAKAQVESQLDAMLQPSVQLRSGGYLVINQTEALVAIDVNSGRSTRERGIEETALRTNMEAAEEAARQLRLRDLAGLIVIDFIDMESRRNNASVEKKLKDALKDDRARIQVGSISHFGLLEMSRQRLRPSLSETNSVPCPHCGGTGHLRSTESAALSVLREIEDEGGRRRSAEIVVHVNGSIALYILNHKRVRLAEIEARAGLHVTFQADDSLVPPQLRIERMRALMEGDLPAPVTALAAPDLAEDPDDAVMEAEDVDADATDPAEDGAAEEGADEPVAGQTAEEAEQQQRKRRRRRRGGRREDAAPLAAASPVGPDLDDAVDAPTASLGESTEETAGVTPEDADAAGEGLAAEASAADGDRKRRGRRGGRRRRREPGAADAPAADGDAAELDTAASPPTLAPGVAPAVAPSFAPAYAPAPYRGPTPANPFGGDSNAFAFFDAVEEIEPAVPMRPAPLPSPIAPIPIAPIPVAPIPIAATAPELTAEATMPDPAAEEPAPAAIATAAEPPASKPAPNEPVVGPAITPILIGTPDAPPVEKRQGWWRR